MARLSNRTLEVSDLAETQAFVIEVARSQRHRQILGGILGVLLGVLLWFAPTPHGLTRVGQSIVAILVFTVFFWAFGVLSNAITAILMLALMILAGVKPEHALGAYAATPFWILLTVLFYGYAMQSTGLAKRLSYWILNCFPPTYPGVLGAFFVIGFVLSPAIPSGTVRTAIVVPISWALVQSLGLKPRSRGCALIMISTVEMAVVPGCATLYGSLWGPLIVQLFTARGYELQWLSYARAMTLPTIIWSLLLLLGNWVALHPEENLRVKKEFAKSELAKMERISRQEIVTAIVVAASVACWVGERWHHQPTYLVGMLAMAVFAVSGILKEKDFGSAVSWPFVLFLGAVFALPAIVQQNKVADWLAGFIVPVIQFASSDVLAMMAVVAVAMFVVRFTDPSGFLSMTVLFLAISPTLQDSPVSAVALIGALLMAGHPFWATYENLWIAMAEGMTGGLAFEDSQRVRLAHVYAVVSLLSIAVSVVYWRVIGLVK
ncbi:MAG: SLC13 family permease [Acidobacteria bacterium]|nr:SLC13 family permease [Acidobacteriota bacterium]